MDEVIEKLQKVNRYLDKSYAISTSSYQQDQIRCAIDLNYQIIEELRAHDKRPI